MNQQKLDELLATRRFCYWASIDGYIEGHGYRVSIVIEDEGGHFPTGTWPYEGKPGQTLPYFWGHDLEDAETRCYAENAARFGLSRKDVDDIVDSTFVAQRREESRLSAKRREQ